MLPSWLIRLVVAVVVAVLPLQGVAGTLQVVLCQPHGAGHLGERPVFAEPEQSSLAADLAQPGARNPHASGHRHGAADHGTPGDDSGHPQDAAAAADAVSGAALGPGPYAAHAAASDDDSGSGHESHFCCDVVAAFLPSPGVSVARFDFQAFEPAPDVFHYSTFLEFPQRPPLV